MKKRGHNDSDIQVMVQEFVDELRSMRYSDSCLKLYRRVLCDFVGAIAKTDPRDISARDLEKYRVALLERGFKPASAVTYFQTVRLFMRYLEEKQQIFANPAADVAPMKVPRDLQPVPTEDEMQILLAQPDVTTPKGIRDRAMLETVYSSGVRRRELMDMTVSCLDLDNGRARIMGKGQRERMVPLGTEAVKWLRTYLRESRDSMARSTSGDALWLIPDGRPMGYENPQQIVARYSKAPGVATRIGLHSIRRACATHMLRHGASAASIQLLLGHSDMRHLSKYLRVAVSDLKKAHEESRLGQ